MAVRGFVSSLKSSLSNAAKILTDPENSEFKELLLRWSDFDSQIPAAIVVAGDEDDVVKTVCRLCFQEPAPFSCSSSSAGEARNQERYSICAQVRRSQSVVDYWSQRIHLGPHTTYQRLRRRRNETVKHPNRCPG
jgi:hypothetical protein